MATTPEQPKLSIITVAWNHRAEAGEFLDAVKRAADTCPFPVEMVLVDNASADGTADYVAEKYPWVNLVRRETNEGFALGCNRGMEAASGEFLLMLNPDAFANTKALAGMVRFLEGHPRVGCVGCQLLHADGMPQMSRYELLCARSYWKNHSILYPATEKIRKIVFKLGYTEGRRPKKTGWMMGSCLMVPRRVYDKVGGFEPSFFMYAEDMDWCHMIQKAGYQVIYLPYLRITHRQKGSSGKQREFCFRRLYRSLVHYGNRQLGPKARRSLREAMLWDMWLRLFVYQFAGLVKPASRGRYQERLVSVRKLIDIVRTGDPDLYDDPRPGSTGNAG